MARKKLLRISVVLAIGALLALIVMAPLVGAQSNAPSNRTTSADQAMNAAKPVAASASKKKSHGGVLFAVVRIDGILVRGKGATGATQLGTGMYEVDFSRDVTQCGYTATLGDPGASSEGPGEISTASLDGNPKGVFVETFNSSGSLTSHDFHLQVAC